MTSLAAQIAAIPAGPQGQVGPTGPQGPQGPQGPGNPLAPEYDDATRDVLTLEGASGTRVANVADGVDPMDAVNRRQMEAGDAATLASAQTHADAGDAATLASARAHADAGDAVVRAYADAGDARTLTAAMAYTDQKLAAFDDRLTGVASRLDGQDRRIDRLGAMSSAQLNMAMNAAAAMPGRGRLAVGLGFQNGEEALSVGYGRRFGNGVSISVGGAFGRNNESSGGVGIGFDLF
ncbi:YadA C-terminal domain-containing protein [Brevundimonas faecalis]|uniref:YadA C-terminal domain-containing protein n=1 Tax=Brevundimonas faecalis TaxID=947378 RepID=UPI0033909F04